MKMAQRLMSPQREAYVEAQLPASPSDPHVIKFMEGYAALQRRAEELQQQCDKQICDIEVRDRQITYLEHELAKLKVEKNAYQRGYLSMKVQVSIVATTAIAALDESKREMLRENIIEDNADPEISAKTEEIVAELGKRFGPVDAPSTSEAGH